MEAITLRPDLRESLEREAQRLALSVEDLANEVVDLYFQRKDEEKIDQEIEAYKAMLPELLQRLPGDWVAIHDQQLVDHDTDYLALIQRVRDRYGNTAILIEQVAKNYVEELWFHTPSTGKLSI